MRDVACLFLAIFCFFSFFSFSVYASDSSVPDVESSQESEIIENDSSSVQVDVIEVDSIVSETEEQTSQLMIMEVSDIQLEFYNNLYALLESRLPLGFSSDYLPDPPPIHELIESDSLVSAFSLSTQTNYPYTGGSFMSVNTNYGNGLIIAPEPFKKDSFAFIKGTNRIINLTNSTISGYWVYGGTTYNLQFSRYGEPQYQYYDGYQYTWRILNISSLTDSNVQFLDETGERGIQNPHFDTYQRFSIAFMIVGSLVLVSVLFFRRR